MDKKSYFLYTENETVFLTGLKKLEESKLKVTDVYSPCSVNELQNSKYTKKTLIPNVALIFGILGALGGFYFQFWVTTMAYPLNFGGKPLLALPSFIPVIFECAVLISAVAIAIVFLSKHKTNTNSIVEHLISADNYIIEVTENDSSELQLLEFCKEFSFQIKTKENDE